ncbi:MAG: hypothetical protein ABIS18_03585 [Actinomycetota bacterium]
MTGLFSSNRDQVASRIQMKTVNSPRLRRGLRIVALVALAFFLLQTIGWIGVGRNRIPPGLVEQLASLNNGRFEVDDAGLRKVPKRLRSKLLAELLSQREIVRSRYEDTYPDETAIDAPIPRLDVDSWLSTPLFGSFSAHISERSLGEGFSRRYVWTFLTWTHVSIGDIYWIT